jgi:predicted glycoside hydrolase/deacetylase ChbG (UPF0249 family)
MTALPQPVPPAASRAICVCVDDFGLHEGVNQAALDLAARHRVSAISCLVDAPAWRTGAAALRATAARVEVGLHLNLTEDFGQGGCHPLARLIVRAYVRRLDRAQIRATIRRQFDSFERAMGRMPDFVDGHQHVHQLPGIREPLVAEMNRRYGGQKPWLRATHASAACLKSGLPLSAVLKSRLIGWLGAGPLHALAGRYGYPQNRHLLGVYDFEGSEADYLRRIERWLGCAGETDVLMCHPAMPGTGGDPLQAARGREYRVLASDAFSALLESAGIGIVPLGDRLRGQA